MAWHIGDNFQEHHLGPPFIPYLCLVWSLIARIHLRSNACQTEEQLTTLTDGVESSKATCAWPAMVPHWIITEMLTPVTSDPGRRQLRSAACCDIVVPWTRAKTLDQKILLRMDQSSGRGFWPLPMIVNCHWTIAVVTVDILLPQSLSTWSGALLMVFGYKSVHKSMRTSSLRTVMGVLGLGLEGQVLGLGLVLKSLLLAL